MNGRSRDVVLLGRSGTGSPLSLCEIHKLEVCECEFLILRLRSGPQFDIDTYHQAENGMQCLNHKDGPGCNLPAEPVDVLVASGSCQPYSAMRRGASIRNVSVQNHPGYGVTFNASDSIVSAVGVLLPRAFISEQVMGFGTVDKSTGLSPKSDFIQAIMGTTDSNGNPHFTKCLSMKMDAAMFLEVSRPRLISNC